MNINEMKFVLSHKIPNIIKGKLNNNLIFAFWGRYLNFGDQMTPVLLKYYGFTPIFSRATNSKFFPKAQIVSVGTILSYIPSDFNGIILGSGMDNEKKSFSHAKILALRGKLTQNNIGVTKVVLGDPGLLMKKVFPQEVRKEYDLGIIPHFIDKNHNFLLKWKKNFSDKNVLFIDVQRKVSEVVNDIKKCRYIVSSSLHGLITADSFDIPNAMFTIRHYKRSLYDDFKFMDYYSAYDEELSVYEANGNESKEFFISLTKNRDGIKKAKLIHDLDSLFRNLRNYL